MTVSILGCGWLGLPLAERLVADGHRVKGAVTSLDKLSVLAAKGILPYQIVFSRDGLIGSTADFLQTDVLIITVPPGKTANAGGLQQLVKALIDHFTDQKMPNIIFVSSISVFGKTIGEITEETPVHPDTDSAKDIVAAEAILNEKTTAVIIRFGGLTGLNRHPVYHLAGKSGIADPDAPINLIHLEDCIGIIQAVLKKDAWDFTLNAVTPFHRSRKAYYVEKANQLQLPTPEFSKETLHPGKTVTDRRSKTILGYDYRIIKSI